MPPRRPAKPASGDGPKKTLYHSELVQMGPVRVTVKSDVLESKYENKPNYVILEIDGHERNYNCENDACETFWDQLKGGTYTVEAVGSREEAGINYLDDAPEAPAAPQRSATPPPAARPAPAAAPPARAAAPPAAAAQPPLKTPPKPQQTIHKPALPVGEPAANALFLAKCHVAKALTLQKLTLNATMTLAAEYNAKAGKPMPDDLFQSINSSLFISAERAMVKASVDWSFYEDRIPMKVDFGTLEIVAKSAAPAPQPAPAAQPQPVAEPEPEPEMPEGDDVPF